MRPKNKKVQDLTLHVTLVGGYNRALKRSNTVEAQYKLNSAAFEGFFPHVDSLAVTTAFKNPVDEQGYIKADGVCHNVQGERVNRRLIIESIATLLANELVPNGATVLAVKISKD